VASTDTLTKFGKQFQTQVVSALLTDAKFLEQIHDLVDIDFFDSEATQWIARELMSHFDEFKTVPSMNVFKVKISELDNDVLKTVAVEKLREVYLQVDSKDLGFVKDKFLEFCKNKKFEWAIHESLTLLENGNYEKIRQAFDDALKAGEPVDFGHDYFEDVEERLEKVVRRTVKTGWPVIDDLMDGGLGPGELGVIVAPPGIGKSWSLTNLAANAVRNGLFAVYYTLELDQNYVGLRFDTVFTGLNSHGIREHKDRVRNTVDKLPGSLIIKHFPTKSKSTLALETHLSTIEAVKGKPDLVLVDYGDILISTAKYSDIRHLELGGIYEDLRRWAGESHLPIWTASQSNRESMELNVITGKSIAESINKLMIADFVMSCARPTNLKINDKANFHIIKNRFGPDGLTFGANMDTEIGSIEIHDVAQPQDSGNGSSNGGEEDSSMEKLRGLYESFQSN